MRNYIYGLVIMSVTGTGIYSEDFECPDELSTKELKELSTAAKIVVTVNKKPKTLVLKSVKLTEELGEKDGKEKEFNAEKDKIKEMLPGAGQLVSKGYLGIGKSVAKKNLQTTDTETHKTTCEYNFRTAAGKVAGKPHSQIILETE
jgi:hypothetical protein